MKNRSKREQGQLNNQPRWHGVYSVFYGESGITFGDPRGGTLHIQITPLLVSLVKSFYFPSSLTQPNLVRLSVK
jgi:hypothetical protein